MANACFSFSNHQRYHKHRPYKSPFYFSAIKLHVITACCMPHHQFTNW